VRQELEIISKIKSVIPCLEVCSVFMIFVIEFVNSFYFLINSFLRKHSNIFFGFTNYEHGHLFIWSLFVGAYDFKRRLNTELIFWHSGLPCYICTDFLCFTKCRNPKLLGPHPICISQFDISYFILFVRRVFVSPETRKCWAHIPFTFL
jgi:hypothetical protein